MDLLNKIKDIKGKKTLIMLFLAIFMSYSTFIGSFLLLYEDFESERGAGFALFLFGTVIFYFTSKYTLNFNNNYLF